MAPSAEPLSEVDPAVTRISEPTNLEAGRASTLPLGERVDARAKVSGSALYAADVSRPGMLIGAILRSPLPHARIVSIDTSAAHALPGVHAVLTGADIPPDARFGRNMRDVPVLARDKVRFVGEKVAAVAAESAEIAEAALRLIDVTYEELPAVFDPLEAIQLGAPLVHDREIVRAWATPRQVVPDYPNGVSAPAYGASVEDVQRALDSAERVFEHTFHTPRQHQVFLEPHACVVEVNDRRVTHVWASHKAPLVLSGYLAEGLGLTRDELDIHMMWLGGDFGGKGTVMDVPVAYFLAKASGRPVKVAMTMLEELTAGNPRHACTTIVRTGVNRDGQIVARWLRSYFNSGAYAGFKPAQDTTLAGFHRGSVGGYHLPVYRSECHMVYTNTIPCGYMRSPGEVQAAYAVECHTDLIAHELGVSPVQFRLLNASRHTRRLDDGTGEGPLRIAELLEAAAEAIDLDEPRPDGVGRGLALLDFSLAPERFSAILSIERDGLVKLQTPFIDNGGGQLTVMRQILAEELGVRPEEILVEQSIQDLEIDRGPSAARTTRLVGKLMIALARRIQERLGELIAGEFGLTAEEVRAEPGGFRLPDGRFFTLAQASILSPEELRENMILNPSDDRCTIHMVQAAEVRVDPETGQVELLRIVSVHEVGRVVHPMLLATQIEGGLMQGVGFALQEGLQIEEGRVVTTNLDTYKVPSMADVPTVEIVVLPPEPALGITPAGEGPNAGIPPAIANAVMDAIGSYPLNLPIRPEAVLELMGPSNQRSGDKA